MDKLIVSNSTAFVCNWMIYDFENENFFLKKKIISKELSLDKVGDFNRKTKLNVNELDKKKDDFRKESR